MRDRYKWRFIFLGLILLLVSPFLLSGSIYASDPSTAPANSVGDQPAENAKFVSGSFIIAPGGESTVLATGNLAMMPDYGYGGYYPGAYYPSRDHYAPVGASFVPRTGYNYEVYYEPRAYYYRGNYCCPPYYEPRGYTRPTYYGYPYSGYSYGGYPSYGYPYSGYRPYDDSVTYTSSGAAYSYPVDLSGLDDYRYSGDYRSQAAYSYPAGYVPPLPPETGVYYSEYIFLRAGETAYIEVRSTAPVNTGVEGCMEFENGLKIFINRVTAGGVEECNDLITSCKLQRSADNWEAYIVFYPDKSERYQLVFANESGETVECEYTISLI